MSTAIPAAQVIFDVGGCTKHHRHYLGCVDCSINRQQLLEEATRKMAYYEGVAEQYNAGLDTFPEATR